MDELRNEQQSDTFICDMIRYLDTGEARNKKTVDKSVDYGLYGGQRIAI